MKTYNPIIYIFSLACAALILSGCETTQSGAAAAAPPANSGQVLIYRVASFGENLGLVVSVDGKDAGTFSEGNNYSGYLSAGQHVITVRADPRQPGAGPGKTTLNVQSGQTYVYTAAWSGGNLQLVKGH